MHDSDLLNLSLHPRPSTTIPVYFIHSFERPFCHNPLCPCQLQKLDITGLFIQIVEGKLELEKAENLVSGRAV